MRQFGGQVRILAILTFTLLCTKGFGETERATQPTPAINYLGYVGPTYGSLTTTQTYSKERESLGYYGAQAAFFRNNIGAGLRGQYLKWPSEGGPSVNVNSEAYVFVLDAKYRVPMKHFSPYTQLGAGFMSRKTNLSILGKTESRSGFSLLTEIGGGIMVYLSKSVALDFSGQYFQVSNINGFSGLVSVGYRLFAISDENR